MVLGAQTEIKWNCSAGLVQVVRRLWFYAFDFGGYLLLPLLLALHNPPVLRLFFSTLEARNERPTNTGEKGEKRKKKTEDLEFVLELLHAGLF